jgi:hypothetical protein
VDGSAALRDVLEHFDSDDYLAFAAACEVLRDRAEEWRRKRGPIAHRLVTFLEGGHRSRSWRGHLSDQDVRDLFVQAAEALTAYDPNHAATWLGWSQRLFRVDSDERIEAANALGRLREVDALEWLVGAARIGPDRVTRAIAAAITRYGSRARHVVPDLRRVAAELSDESARPLLSVIRAHDSGDLWGEGRAGSVFELARVGLPRDLDAVLATETTRLQEWLDSGANRAQVEVDPAFIESYSEERRFAGEPSPIRWVPIKILPEVADPTRWRSSFSEDVPGGVLVSNPAATGAERRRSASLPWLVRLLPVDTRLPTFTETHLSSLRVNRSVAWCQIADEHLDRYVEFLKNLARDSCYQTYLIDGVVVGEHQLAGIQGRENGVVMFGLGQTAGEVAPLAARLRAIAK